MECIVDEFDNENNIPSRNDAKITFLYTLGNGACPRSFGINVARLAGLPEDVLSNAARISAEFEETVSKDGQYDSLSRIEQKRYVLSLTQKGDFAALDRAWQELQEC
jgi:DNA mismatch repair ATPase MutS